MSYLRIMNPGVCDYRSFILLGVSSSRNSEDCIGQFGSGAKFGTDALLRGGLAPIIFSGRMKLEYTTKSENVDGVVYDRVCVNLSGKDETDTQIKRTEKTDRTLQGGVYDWTEISFGLREWVSNALDGCTANGHSHKDVVIDVVEKPRAKKGYTQVYVEYTPEVEKFVKMLGDLFLHFNENVNPSDEVIEKSSPGPARIYHRGVLIRTIGEKSLYDYNCPDLTINESRTSDEYNCRHAVAAVLSKDKKALKNVLRNTINRSDLFECTLSEYYWRFYESRKNALEECFNEEFGTNSVLCDDRTANHVQAKGYIPVRIHDAFEAVLRTLDRVQKDSNVLNGIEIQGLNEEDPTDEVLKVSKQVWETLEYLELTNGKKHPTMKCMWMPMEGNAKVSGLQSNYKDGTIWIDKYIGGIDLVQTVVHEMAHHVTGAMDSTRDLEDFAFLAFAKTLC